MAYREKVTIVRADEIATDIYEMCFSTKNIAKEAKPGQFVSVYSNDGSRLLPRPISICGIEGDTLRIVYRAIGKGTQDRSLKYRDRLATAMTFQRYQRNARLFCLAAVSGFRRCWSWQSSWTVKRVLF